MENFSTEVKKRYDEIENKEQELKKELERLRSEKKPLMAYLKEVGMIEVKRRAKRIKAVN
ncbi:hypothetical protein [uncultured Desulfosarcina sp.]|uniref:hypothetical protein n=1 Tax=uncultured Desulfosarcina sp. TaxID=218289 RepID=UPI0029C88B5F|nr:hypothetical protein [uncultured Desulfosarcina sp.]